MKLDRNLNPDGRGKYALIKLRDVKLPFRMTPTRVHTEVPTRAIDFGDTDDSDFFVIRLKDKYAAPAIEAYATEAIGDDPEYAAEIFALADKARNHPSRKKPD